MGTVFICLSKKKKKEPSLSCVLQVIRVKWSLHAREEIVFELLQYLRGNATRALLEGVRKSTREMISEQEAVRGRLFTIQDVMQSTVRAWLQVYILLTRQKKFNFFCLNSSLRLYLVITFTNAF